MQKQKLRHELKHNINISDCIAVRQRLRAIVKRDPHAGSEGNYKIRSLYFDNIDDKALLEKINGVNNREKFRIRYYNDNFDYIRLEKKSKINGLCSKISARLTKEQCEKIISGEIDWMKYSDNPLLVELYTKMKFQQLRPKTLVDYTREAFIYEPGNVRITIDSNIRTGMNSKELFNQEVATMRTHGNSTIILEVKFDEFLPSVIRDIIQVNNRQSLAFSKYAVCRMFG
ncbi:VTC domain-containing protein [Ruminiclostridium sufflavum DSM 19573]|uniref:VTC domain-containing protein n=1 Tax=Ruminiclostridium sufflavum DSM 19573 TaxID=1121337 RepID=A0A318XNH2_9FIRM|nr:polyphosphate polymerase domain-containing protein [Ruminiclostridium sufflavum]PYG89552.1 VTC domain-containing protein [Ruminiclostridium sufflavum DSM 19573]